jgi:hypothetical protein
MPAFARSAWLSVETPSVRILTEFSRRDTDKIIDRIYLHRYVIGQYFKSWHRFTGNTSPLVVVLRGDTWRTYTDQKKQVAGFTVQTPSGQLILVNGDAWDNTARVVLHEMTHYYFRLNAGGIRIPLWYEEGSADFFSTTRGYLGQVQLGVPTESWWDQLRTSGFIPLDQLMTATQESPAYLRNQGGFYAESWALIQYTRVDNEKAAVTLRRYLAALQTTKSPEEVIQSTFGDDQREFQSKFFQYVQAGLTHWTVIPAPPAVIERQTIRTLSEDESRRTFGRILIDFKPQLASTTDYIEKAEKIEGPNSPLAAMLARLYFDKRRNADANALLNIACGRGDVNAELHIECANALLSRAYQGGDEALGDARRARGLYQQAWSADSTRLTAVTRQAETYSIAPDDSSQLRDTLEGLVDQSDVSSLIWEELALLYRQIDKRKQLICLHRALLSEHDIAVSDRLRKEILVLSEEIKGT